MIPLSKTGVRWLHGVVVSVPGLCSKRRELDTQSGCNQMVTNDCWQR